MDVVNIGLDNADDAFYRYKMPKLQAKVEGRGNGIKTNIVNMVDIAKALGRPPSYTTKFFGCELGAQTKFDEKTGLSIVNGQHDQKDLINLLDKFIKGFVQCHSCGNPETVMKVKRGLIVMDCKACGARSNVDMAHKLTTFILNWPPQNEKKDKKDKKEDKKDKKDKKKKEKKEKRERSKENLAEDNGEEEEKVNGGPEPENNEDDGDDDDDDVVWATDVSEAAVRARAAEQLTEAASAMVAEPVIEEEEDDEDPAIVKETRAFAKENGPKEVVKFLEGKAELKNAQQRALILFLALMGESPNDLHKKVVEKKPYLSAVARGEQGQKIILSCVEYFCTQIEPSLIRKIPAILHILYEHDLAEEDAIVAWYDGGYKLNAGLGIEKDEGKLIRKAAAKFVEYLQQEDDDEEEEEDD